jgi:hypothetical protein
MTARAIGDVLAGRPGAKARRTFQPVRRDSRHVGEREHLVWRALGSSNREARRFINAMVRAAEWFEERNREPGRVNGPLGDIGVRVLRELFRIADWKSGRLEPAILTICARIHRSKTAVVDALRRLKEHGFLKWLRRTEPTDNAGEAGPQVRQISNAYGFDLQELSARAPTAAAFVKKAIGFGMPAPDCETARRDQDKAETEAMLDAVSAEEVARFRAGDGPLGDALASLARSLGSSASQGDGKNPGDGE